MTERQGTAAGSTQESGDTRHGSEAAAGDEDRALVYGGTPAPADASAVADADHPGLPADGDLGDATPGLATGSDEGEPGARRPVPPGDAVAAAVEDDAPLAEPLSGQGGADSDDGLAPEFREPGGRE